MGSFVEVMPPKPLRQFIERLWVHRLDGPPPREGRRLLPDGRITLAWVDGVGVRIAGPQTGYLTPPDMPRMLAFGASFHPGAAPQLLRVPAAELRDQHIQLDAIVPRLARRLDDQLANAAHPEQGLRAFAAELRRELRSTNDPDPVVRDAVRYLMSRSGRVAEAAATAFVSERELQRRFNRHVGYGPKTLHRVLRFQRFMRHISDDGLDLASAAAHAGYADQPHLTREARRLAGLTPQQLITWRH
jgi:AraC-like DNA-binding protein